MLFSPKRTCFRFAALTLRVSSRRKAGWCEEGGGRRMPDGGVPPLAVNFLGSLLFPHSHSYSFRCSVRVRGRRAVRAAPRGCAGPERESGAGAAKVLPREWGLRGLPPVGAACAGRQPLSPLRRQLPPSHRNAPSGRSGVAHGFFSEKSIRCSFLQNAHASGSLRSPYGYRGAIRLCAVSLAPLARQGELSRLWRD